jgi:hypothetical protein
MTQPSGTLGLSHLLMAADAELALVDEVVLYLGKAKVLWGSFSNLDMARYTAI